MRSLIDRISALSHARRDVFDLIAVAIVIALGTNIAASGLIALLPSSGWGIILSGVTILVIGLILIFSKIARGMNSMTSIKGVIFIEKESRKSLGVDRYDLANGFADAIKGLSAENKGLAKIWSTQSFERTVDNPDGSYNSGPTQSRKIAIEALEYYVLHSLSVHLTDYFNLNESVEKSELHVFNRSDFPQVLLDNRFIDLFCRPLDEREAFQHHGDSPHGRVVYAVGADGEVFDDFDLTLPKDAQIVRKKHGSIKISTARFALTISCDIEGSSVEGGFDFLQLYMGYDWDKVDATNCIISIEVQFYLSQVFSRKGWHYYEWLDSFLDEIIEDASFARFLKRIAWEDALTVDRVRQNYASRTKIKPRRAASLSAPIDSAPN